MTNLQQILKKQEEEFDDKYLPKDNGDGTYSQNKYVFPSGAFAQEIKDFIRFYNTKIIAALCPEIKKNKLELEPSNFRVNSKGWKETELGYSQNPKGDIYEILKGDYKGEQLFTWDAAMRETKKAGQRMPTMEEWKEMFKDERIPNFPMVGYRGSSSAALYGQGSYGACWSSSPNGTYAYNLYFSASGVKPAEDDYRADGFSVRCFEEKKRKKSKK